MTVSTVKEEIISQLDELSLEQQQRVLDFARKIKAESQPESTSGDTLLAYMDTFQFEPGDLEEIAQAIEEGCERIDWDAW